MSDDAQIQDRGNELGEANGDLSIESQAIESILNAEQIEDIRSYLQKEIGDTQANAGREERIARNLVIDRQRQIQPDDPEKNFPWDGAANTVPPLMWTKISSVVSKFTQAILNKDPLFVYQTSDPKMSEHASAITRHIKDIINDPNLAGFRKTVWPLEFDKASFGTVFLKVPFEREVRFFTRRDSATGAMTKVKQIVRSCAKPYIIPFEDFLTRPEWTDIQKAPWIAVRNYKFFHELKALEASQFYENVELIWDRNETFDDFKIAAMTNAGITESFSSEDPNKIYKIYEVNMFFDVDGTGDAQDIVIHYEQESNTILRVEYNGLGRRDILRIPYVELARTLYGMGIGDMTSNLQTMIETVFNNSFNSDELSYMGILVTRQGSGIEFGKDVYPGAVLSVPNPNEDLKLFQFPSATASSMMLEQKIMAYADLATGATSMMVGQEQKAEGNRIGSSGTQFLAAQGNAYLEAFLELAVNGYQEIGELVLMQMVSNSELVDLSSMSPSDQVLLKEVYSTPVEEITSMFKFSVSLADIQQEVRERQGSMIQLFQLYGAFMDKVTQITAALSNPQLAQPGMERMQDVLMTSYVGFNKLFTRILDNFNEKEAQDLVPYYEDMELVLQKLDEQKGEIVERERYASVADPTNALEQGGADAGGAGAPEVVDAGVQEGPQESPSVQGGPGGPQSGI